jgi:thiosulfate dehydrogenase (quinone) large subunit
VARTTSREQLIGLADEENTEQLAETLARKYELKIPDDVVASILASKPRLPVLLSRAAFRADAVRTSPEVRVQRERRTFLRNVLGLAAVSLPILLWIKVAFFSPQAQTPSYVSNPGPQAGERLLANASTIAMGQSVALSDPTYGPMLLIHLMNGQFVAYSAICTHAGCQVQFNPSAQDIACPCHGAVYDPSNNAQVIAGPAPYPLQKISIRYDQSSGDIFLQG